MVPLQRRLTALAGLVAFGAALLLLGGTVARPGANTVGRVLNDGEMAAVFGDADGNGLCKQTQICLCNRKGAWMGQSACLTCNDGEEGGATTPWTICCPTSNPNKSCQETGDPACAMLFIYFTVTYTDQISCCSPCTNITVWVPTQTRCTNIRKHASAMSDAC
jgi:hypothetical protein